MYTTLFAFMKKIAFIVNFYKYTDFPEKYKKRQYQSAKMDSTIYTKSFIIQVHRYLVPIYNVI